MIPDPEMQKQEQERTLSVCPKCGRSGRLLTDRENADEDGYFNLHYWHPDTDKKCHISRGIDLERAMDNELRSSTPSSVLDNFKLEIQNKINPKIYKEFLTKAKHEDLSETQAWDWAMHLFLTQSNNSLKSIAPMQMQKQSRGNIKRSQVRRKRIIEPIAIDLSGDERMNIPSLRQFYESKLPETHYQKIATFAYYLTRIKNHRDAQLGQIAFCYKELHEKVPSIKDLVRNASRYKQYVKRTSTSTVELTARGNDIVESLGNKHSQHTLQT